VVDSDRIGHVDAVIDLLLTIGYVDGLLAEGEQQFIKQYLGKLVEHVATDADQVAEWKTHVDEAYKRLDIEIAALAAEVVAADDEKYMSSRLKVRAVALFRSFKPSDQKVALELFHTVMHTDGSVSPQERELHEELLAYFHARPTLPLPVVLEPPADMLGVEPAVEMPLTASSHPMLDPIEQSYAADPSALHAQLGSDYNLVFQAIGAWERQRARGNGRLAGITDIAQLPPGTRFLDGHVHVLRPDRPTELIVLGDVHGCYSCLKAAVMQSGFIDKALRHQQDPVNNPDTKLVLLGDYIDRGRYSFEGVLRGVLQLISALPDHVIALRGNHEFFVRHGDRIASAVQPAEAIPAAADIVPLEVLEAYRHLFEHMPTSLLFERTLFVHGGIPRDDTLAERYRDLSSLDDAVMRFEMMWADPVDTDHVPVTLQRESPRFTFGRDQFRVFMDRIGCQTMIRGHEQIDDGFHTTFDLGQHRLHTLFSSGGRDNSDLPARSRYRSVTPMALTVRWQDGQTTATPWPLAYQPFNLPANNGLYRPVG
jgi:hypothetical protein